ncbi:MAG: hypothetical protein IPM39_28875 [Chloroflexi bacterium]|nr:hypothetical protein [Chloroflexota bacterium]
MAAAACRHDANSLLMLAQAKLAMGDWQSMVRRAVPPCLLNSFETRDLAKSVLHLCNGHDLVSVILSGVFGAKNPYFSAERGFFLEDSSE